MFLCLQNHILNTNLLPKLIMKSSKNTRTQNKYFSLNFKGTSLFACRKGSFTLECAVIIPISAGFLASILFLFQVIRVQAIVEEAALYTGRIIAVESSVVSDEKALFLSTEGLLLLKLQEEGVLPLINNGLLGINIVASDFQGEYINLKINYFMKLPVSFWEIKNIELSCENRFRKWNGNLTKAGEGNWVYITEHGKVYHVREDCQAIKLTIMNSNIGEVEKLRGKDGQKFYPCSGCVEHRLEGLVVYYTNYGVLYHESIYCSALKRTVYRVPETEVSGRKLCSFCGY